LARERFSPIEFAIVIGAAFGYSAVGSIDALLAGRTVGATLAARDFGETHLYWTITYELVVAPFILGVLYVGGWRLHDLRIGPSVAGTIMGIVIFAGMWLGFALFGLLMKTVLPALQSFYDMWGSYRPSAPPTLLGVLLLSIVNPVFEEVFVCGYVIEALRGRFGTTTAINVSVVIRASYHLYQGLGWQPYHIAYGLVQGYVYARYGRLWPLFVSHALLDFVPLAFYLV
jgi:membrane protease YdiL (CAAX protease family)